MDGCSGAMVILIRLPVIFASSMPIKLCCCHASKRLLGRPRIFCVLSALAVWSGSSMPALRGAEATDGVQGAPECASYVFNEQGKCRIYTGGYIMDRQVCSFQLSGCRVKCAHWLLSSVVKRWGACCKILIVHVRAYVHGRVFCVETQHS